MIRNCLFAAFLAGMTLPALAANDPAPAFKAGLLGKPEILLPTGEVSGAIFLFSDKGGWTDADQQTAETLQKAGAIVVGVDTAKYLAGLEIDKADECVYLVADIEDLSHQIQRSLGTGMYHSPVVAGVGAAGALGLAIAAQTPDATIGRTVVVDPDKVLPLVKPLCTDAPRVAASGGTVYGLAQGDLTNPVDVLYTAAAPADGKAHVEDLQKQGFKIKDRAADGDARAALEARLLHVLVPKSASDDPLADLQLIELPTTPKLDTLAIVYSGDGGWRDLDKSVAEALQKEGVPTVGLDSLRYFWSEKSPEQTSADLARIIEAYLERWNVEHVILIGYSFGADVLPNAYNRLPADVRDSVAEMSLLGLSEQVDYEISVGEFLGTGASAGETLPDLKRIKPGVIQCVYGEDEGDSACPKLEGSGVEMIKTAGGHHFDGDYDALAAKILDGFKRRTAGEGHPQAQK
ncbi:AcvB/VirJ family lysyl-phosphatidylglycerol hydrolase [Kaistia adipata]|uniref:AcvB/VirJ family lysyl-phosphatidylglycerol hydrolase n=1 Tax=Kaistia adipata TaxID=166954 RepID=UPI000414D943|nr:AcvB/VirJ family lysyl-phosphatidylglycerol hydrolase [Kaistia adipata]